MRGERGESAIFWDVKEKVGLEKCVEDVRAHFIAEKNVKKGIG